MNRMSYAALFCILVSNAVAAQEPARAELLGNIRVVEAAVEPEFIDLTAEQLKEQLEVVSSRCYAVFGFNNPEVQIHLPRFDNSIYASVEFSEPRLLDAAGSEVRYELERGIYDHDTHSDEIRFAPADGGPTVAFARRRGLDHAAISDPDANGRNQAGEFGPRGPDRDHRWAVRVME